MVGLIPLLVYFLGVIVMVITIGGFLYSDWLYTYPPLRSRVSVMPSWGLPIYLGTYHHFRDMTRSALAMTGQMWR